MKTIKHDNIVQIKTVFETPQKVYIVMEYCIGEFESCITKLDEHEVRLIIQQLAQVVAYLHTIGVVHRDIKPVFVTY